MGAVYGKQFKYLLHAKFGTKGRRGERDLHATIRFGEASCFNIRFALSEVVIELRARGCELPERHWRFRNAVDHAAVVTVALEAQAGVLTELSAQIGAKDTPFGGGAKAQDSATAKVAHQEAVAATQVSAEGGGTTALWRVKSNSAFSALRGELCGIDGPAFARATIPVPSFALEAPPKPPSRPVVGVFARIPPGGLRFDPHEPTVGNRNKVGITKRLIALGLTAAPRTIATLEV